MARAIAALGVVALLVLAPVAAAQAPTGVMSDNVQFVKNITRHWDSSGGRALGGYYYITTERDLSIYDVSDPENPVMVGNVGLATPGEPTFPEEDPDTNGKVLFVSNTDFMAYDVSDKTNPHLIGTLAGTDQHTLTCALDCTWVYGTEGAIVDARDPTQPKLAGNWTDAIPGGVKSPHDLTEVSPGILVTSSRPFYVLDVRQDPVHPTILARGQAPGFMHGNIWPGGGTDDFLLAGGETIGPGCEDSDSSVFMTFNARDWLSTKTFPLIDKYKLSAGTYSDGHNVTSSWCTHWFAPNPTFANGGLVGIAWYEQGVRFLKVDRAGKIQEIGYYLPTGGQSSDVEWITDRVAYVADYLRGLDIVKFVGDIPPGFPHPAAPDEPAPPPTTPTPATPSKSLPSFDRLVRFPGARRCVRARGFRVRTGRVESDPVVWARLRVNGRIVATARTAKALERGMRARRLPRGRFSVQVEVRTLSGYRTAGQRFYTGCRA